MESGYTGINKNQFTICNQFVKHFGASNAENLQKRFDDLLKSDIDNIDDSFIKIIDILQTNLPKNFDEYIGHIAFTSLIALAKVRSKTYKTSLYSRLFSLDIDEWANELSKVKIIM